MAKKNKAKTAKQHKRNASSNSANKEKLGGELLLKGYPPVLWALALFVISLGFSMEWDIALLLLTVTAVISFSNTHLQKQDWQVQKHWPLLFFLAVSLLCTLASVDIARSFSVQAQFAPALLVYAVIVQWGQQQKHRLFISTALVLAGLLMALVFLVEAHFSGGKDALHKVWRVHSPLIIAPNDVLFLAVIAPFAAGLLLMVNKMYIKALALAFIAVALLTTIYMQSRQGVAVLLVALFIVFFIQKPLWGLVVSLFGLAAILIVDWVLGMGLLKKLFLFPRIYIWEAAWAMFLDSPAWGHGPGMFKVLYYEYLEKAGYVFEEVSDRRPMNWAHSLYLEQLAERGFIGLMALLTLFIAGLISLRAAWVGVNGAVRVEISVLLASFVAMMLAGIAEASLLRLWCASILLILLAFSNCLVRSEPA